MRSKSHARVDSKRSSSYFLRVSKRRCFRYDSLGQSIHDQREDECTMAVSTITDDKKKALNLAISQIEKSCGKGSIMRLGTESKVRVEAIPTGAINLDAAIGIAGIPRGGVTEIYRPETSGQTTRSLHFRRNAQRGGGGAGYI